MSLTATIAGVSVSIEDGALSRPDRIDQKTMCTVTIVDGLGTAFYQKGQPIIITDSLLGEIFRGVIHAPRATLLYPSVTKLWALDCISRGDYLASKRTTNKAYNAQYSGTVLVDQIQRYGSSEGLSAKAALRWDEAQSEWAGGTLTGTVAQNNVNIGDLELSLAGSVVSFSQSSQADFNAGTTGLGLSSPSSGGVTFTPTQAIKLQATQSVPGAGNAYTYVQIWSGSYVIVSGDVFYYDVWIASTSPQQMAAMDATCSDGSVLRDVALIAVWEDVQGLGPHPSTDLTGLATDQWYSRRFFVDGLGSWIGKTITSITVAFEGDNSGTYTAYFRNVSIKNGGTTHSIFAATDTATQSLPQQLQNNGYSNMTCTVVTAYERTGLLYSPLYDLSAAAICRSSFAAWKATIPSNCSLLITAAADRTAISTGSATFLPLTNNAAIPVLTPGQNVTGLSLRVIYSMTNTGPDPTITPVLSKIAGTLNPAYAATKSDVVFKAREQADWQTGTLTNLRADLNSNLFLDGYQRNWDNSDYSNQTQFGVSSPAQGVTARTFFLQAVSAADTRTRLDFVGSSWQDFTAEVDIQLSAANMQLGLVYRTTNWGNSNDSYAYMVIATTTQLVLGHGNNSTGAGSFTGISTVSLTLSSGNWHRLKIVVAGNTHKAYLDNVLYINATDSTYPSAGYVGLRFANLTGATAKAYFDNFGIMRALSGTWVSPAIDLHALGSIYGSTIRTSLGSDVNTSLASSLTEISLDNGVTWAPCANASTVPGLTNGVSVSGITQARLRLTLTSSTATSSLDAYGLLLQVFGRYASSGTRVSPSLSLAGVGRAATTLVNWNALLPTGTGLAVQTSINGGTSWQTLVNPGDPVTGLVVQPDPIEDVFASNSATNYIQGNFGGTTGAWVWDTANRRLSGSGGVNGTLTLLAALAQADSNTQVVIDQADGSGLLANYSVSASGYYLQIWDASAVSTQNTIKLFKRSASANVQIGATTSISFTRGTPHLFTFDVQSGVLTVSMDNSVILTYTDGAPLGTGKNGLLLNILARVYVLRVQQYGQNVTALSLLTKLTLTSTNPTVTPQILNMQAFVSSQDINVGVLLPSINYALTYINNNIDDMTKKSDYWSYIRADGSVVFQPRTATQAPCVLSSLNSQVVAGQVVNDVMVSGAELDNSADSYRNRQIMQGAIATASFPAMITGDGSTVSWQVVHPLTTAPSSMSVNGQSVTFGVKGIDTGRKYYYQIGSTAIDQDSAQIVLQTTDVLTVVYTGSFSQDVTLNNTGQFPGTISQSQMAAIDGSSGIVESVLDVSSTPTSVAVATLQGNQLLQRYGNIGRTFKCKTLRSGFAPGQQVPIFVPEFGLSNVQMLITDVSPTLASAPGVSGGILYAWQLSMTEGPNLGSWVQLFQNIITPLAGGGGGTVPTTVFRQKNVIYAEDFGVIGDGLTDDTAALQACFNAAVAGTDVRLAPVVYLVTGSITYPGGIRITGYGDSDTGTVIRVKTGTALTTPVLCSADWYNNSATSGNPVEISDLKIDGNSATSGLSAHGLVSMNFWSSFDRITILNVAGDGFLLSAQSRNATHISNTCVEAKIKRLQIRTCGGDGIHIADTGSGLNSCTDGFIEDCIVTSAGINAINVEMGPGWYLSGNHIYGTVTNGIQVSKCYATRVHGNYVDSFGSGSSTYIAGIGMSCINGRGSSCIGNHVSYETGAATGPYQGIAITGAGSATSICTVAHNTVIGASQSGSLGFVFQTSGAQIGHTWLIYAHDNDAQAVATNTYEDTNVTGGDFKILGHIGSASQNSPTAAAGANAGTSPPVPVLTRCSDLCGKITFGTGTTPAAGSQAVVTFNVAYPNAPVVVLTPINAASASLTLHATSATTTFTVSSVSAPSASQANTVYGFFYHVFL